MNMVERSILGSIMAGLKPSQVVELSDMPNPAHRAILGAIRGIEADGLEVSLPLVHERLRGGADPEGLWSSELFTVMEHQVGSQKNLDSLVVQLKREARSRVIRQGAAALASGSVPPESVAGHVQRLADLAGASDGSRSATHVSKGLERLFSTASVPSVPFGMECLRDLEVNAGQVCVVGARPGVGKTAFLGTVCLNAAREGWRCLFLSLEMPSIEIQQRLLAGLSRIPIGDIKRVSNPKMLEWARSLAELPIWVEDGDEEPRVKMDLEGVTPLVKLFAEVSRADGVNGVVFLDYIQFMHTRQRIERRHEAVGHVIRSIKRLARDSNVPIIAAAQLSRLVEQRGKDSRPQMSDLSDSADIEKNADKILFLHRTDAGECFIRVAKNRQGPVWTCEANYAADICTFEDKGWV